MNATNDNTPDLACRWCRGSGWAPLDDGYPPEPPHYIDTQLCDCPAGVTEREKIKARQTAKDRSETKVTP